MTEKQVSNLCRTSDEASMSWFDQVKQYRFEAGVAYLEASPAYKNLYWPEFYLWDRRYHDMIADGFGP
jgi:hypothetical protein